MSVSERLQYSLSGFAVILTQPVRSLRRRVNAWIMTRTKRQPGPVSVSRRRVYIVPTRFGYMFAIMLLIMLLGAMNYSNSMAFALTFLLTGLGLIAMHHTHGNLVNVRVMTLRAAPVYAGETAVYELELDNPSARSRWNLMAGWPEEEPQGSADLPARERNTLQLSLPAERRGWLPAPRFTVATEFPLGLFHAWTWIEIDCACLVYPRPASAGLIPPAASGLSGTQTGLRPGQDEFAGLRGYQRGDSASHIHWKTLPRMTTPQVKHFSDTIDPELWLDWNELPPGLDTERRLSQLTRWILEAEAGRRSYGLRLPGFRRAPAQGELHRNECLKALALFDAATSASS
jgi:uncharacterized protein (DUF58 family)